MLDAAEIKRQVPIETVVAHYGGALNAKGEGRCLCPHNHKNGDADPSMTVKDGRVMCWSQQCFGEKGADVFELVGLMENLTAFTDQKRRVCEIGGIVDQESGNGPRRIVEIYGYTDETGTVLFQTVRYDPKDFMQRRPDGQGGWIWKLGDTRPVLYRLPEVLKAETVLIVEGEKDAETAYRLGLPDGWAATCNPMGAGKWRKEYSEALKGKRVVILPDADEPGRKHGEQVARSLDGKAREILAVALPEVYKDLSEWATGKTAEDFKELLASTALYAAPEATQSEVPWRCSLTLLREVPTETAWLLHGVIPAESVVLLSGREGTMKTWLTLEWAKAVAEDGTWLGHVCEVGAVLWLDAEMPGNLFHARLHAVGGSRNLNVWRWQDEDFPQRLDDPRLLKAARTHRLIVVDTLKRFMQGLKENDSDDMAKVTDALRQLTRHGATVFANHHAPKDPERSGYRGSTELGAGVDITLTLKKDTKDGVESLALTADKTRFAQAPCITLRVERGKDRPVFHDTSGEDQVQAQHGLVADLERLASVIGDLQATKGTPPNQSQVIEEAKSRGLGSRNTILVWLKQGEGERWQSETDGRSRIYTRIIHLSTYSTTRGEEELDNSSNPSQATPNLSTCPGV